MMHVAARVCMMFRCLGAYNEDSTYKFISNEECSELAAHATHVVIAFLAYRLANSELLSVYITYVLNVSNVQAVSCAVHLCPTGMMQA